MMVKSCTKLIVFNLQSLVDYFYEATHHLDEKDKRKYFIAVSQRSRWHLRIDFSVWPTVQNQKTLSLQWWYTDKSTKSSNMKIWNQSVLSKFWQSVNKSNKRHRVYLHRYKRHKRLNPRRLFCIALADKTHQKLIRL